MSLSDPIADMLTRIRNAVDVGHPAVAMPSSKMKVSIAKILKDEGYIESYSVVDGDRPSHKVLRIRLKYVGERRGRQPVISGIERISKPGRRYYAKKHELPRVLSGMGTAIISTPKGVMTDRRARQLGVGGEVICKVW
jgi:small subunit ribosomal protein S8